MDGYFVKNNAQTSGNKTPKLSGVLKFNGQWIIPLYSKKLWDFYAFVGILHCFDLVWCTRGPKGATK